MQSFGCCLPCCFALSPWLSWSEARKPWTVGVEAVLFSAPSVDDEGVSRGKGTVGRIVRIPASWSGRAAGGSVRRAALQVSRLVMRVMAAQVGIAMTATRRSCYSASAGYPSPSCESQEDSSTEAGPAGVVGCEVADNTCTADTETVVPLPGPSLVRPATGQDALAGEGDRVDRSQTPTAGRARDLSVRELGRALVRYEH